MKIKSIAGKVMMGTVLSLTAMVAIISVFFANVLTTLGTFVASMTTTLCFMTALEQPKVPKCLIKE